MTDFSASLNTQIHILRDEIDRLEQVLAVHRYDAVARYRCDVFKVILRGLVERRKPKHGEVTP